MFCKSCGKYNPDQANFCGNCGKVLRGNLVSYRHRKRRVGVKIIIIIIFLMSLATYLSYLIFEPVSLPAPSSSLKNKLEALVKDSKSKTIDFYLTFTPQEIDGYLNEEVFKKRPLGFNSIQTTLLKEEIEIALSRDFLYIPTLFRIRIKPENKGGEEILSTSGMSLGRVPIPHFLYPFFYRQYPWLDFNYLLKITGIKFKDIRIEKDKIFLKGSWSSG